MSRNTMKTSVLLALLGGLFVLVGGLIAPRTGSLIGLGLGLVMVGGSYWFSATLAIRAAGARRVTAAELPRLAAIVAGLADRAGLPMPDLYLVPTAQPNAFATGRNPQRAAVCVTEGALDRLDDDELQAVLAHELSHVANRDILIGSIAAAIALALTLVARLAMWGTLLGGGRGRRGNLIGLLAMSLLAPLAAFVVQMAIARSREFEADRSGADLLGTGEPLARALAKIDATARTVPMHVDPAHATAYIVNPLTGRRVAFAQLFATHPPTAERIARLHAETAHLQRVEQG
ncbi:MAG: M48 family metalloprotease [Acidimicrobiales bacterium]